MDAQKDTPQANPAAEAGPKAVSNILDKITSDPNFINRGVADAMEPVEAKAMPVLKSADLPGHAEPLVLDRDPHFERVVEPNLLPPKGLRRHGRKLLPVVVIVAVLAVTVGAGAYVLVGQKPAPQVARTTPTPSATPAPTPTPSPSPTPSPTPPATPAPETVTAPVVAPTTDHPQAVKITSNSGLWLRSSPTSENRSNIIGWMPNGATVSVDSTGDFWWHGTYKGQPGYFASKYTH